MADHIRTWWHNIAVEEQVELSEIWVKDVHVWPDWKMFCCGVSSERLSLGHECRLVFSTSYDRAPADISPTTTLFKQQLLLSQNKWLLWLLLHKKGTGSSSVGHR
jgi:hypothetical protein